MISIGALIAIAVAPVAWQFDPQIVSFLRVVGYVLILVAWRLAWWRGFNELTPAFWFLLIISYPVIAPMFSFELLGYDFYASGSTWHQNSASLSIPVLLAGIACLLFAIHLDSREVSMPAYNPRGWHRAAHWRAGPIFLLFFASLLALFMANFLDAPPSLLSLGAISYKEIKSLRDDTLNVAAAFVVIFAAVSLLSSCMVLRSRVVGERAKILCATCLFVSFSFVAMWQVMSGSRIESVGILLAAFLFFGDRISRPVRFVGVGVAVVAFGAVGYLRTLTSYRDYVGRDFVSWPGGVENVLNTYVYAVDSMRTGGLELQLGQTYMNLIARLPPNLFGFERPPRAYELLSDRTRLIGGEYFLTEPFMNFMGLGVAVFIIFVIVMLNGIVRKIAIFHEVHSSFPIALIATAMLMYCFRLFWYGLEHFVKMSIVALIVSIPILILTLTSGAKRSNQRRVHAARSLLR